MNVTHFRKFRSPLWILNNGPNTPNKILTRATQKIFVEFDNGACADQYYSKDMQRILTSQNYKFIEPNTLPTVDETTDPSTDQHDRGPGTGTTPVPAHNMSSAGSHK